MKNFLFLFSLIIFISLSQHSNAAIKLTMQDFASQPDLRDVKLSPDGKYLAMVRNRDKHREVIVRDLSAKGAPIVGMLSEKIIRPSNVYWANNKRLIVNLLVPQRAQSLIEQDADGEEIDLNRFQMFYRSIAMDPDGKNIVVLMEEEKRLKGNRDLSSVSNFLPDDENHVIIPARRRGFYEIYKVNVNDGKAERIARGGYRTYKIATDSNGKPLYRLDFLRIARTVEFYTLDDEGDWDKVDEVNFDQAEQEGVDLDGLLQFGINQNRDLIYRKKNETTGYYEIIKRSRDNNSTEVLVSLPDQDVHAIITDSRSDDIIGYQVQSDLIRNRYFKKDKQTYYDAIEKHVGEYNFFFESRAKQGSKAVIFSYGMDDPGSYFLYDKAKDELGFLRPYKNKLVPENMAIPAKAVYKTRDGQKIRLYIYFPPTYKQGESSPMVVMPHGGPHMRDSATYDDFAQFIATRGYIVIQPNFRGSSGYGKQFEEAGYKQWGQLMQDDVTDAVKFMLKHKYADPKKICIVGGSYGGYVALMGAVKTPDLYQCAISLNGVTHLKDQIEFDIDTAGDYEEKVEAWVHKTIGHPEKEADMLDQYSPALHASKINIPVMLIAGRDDEVVPYRQSVMMKDALQDKDKAYEYILIKDTGHNLFYYQEDIEKVYSEVETFLSRYLK